MSHARPPHDGEATRGRSPPDRDDAATTKVVLMELVEAGRPLSATDLVERTLLSETAVATALATLQDMDLCHSVPGDERRPDRFAATDPHRDTESAAADTPTDDRAAADD